MLRDVYDFVAERFSGIADKPFDSMPAAGDGREGEFRLVNDKGTIHLCIKCGNVWYKFEGSRVHAE